MIGMILLLLGSLIIGLATDSAVDTRLAVLSVRAAKRRTIEELAARSAIELAAHALQLDKNRRRDTLSDRWATFSLPEDSEYSGVWPDNSQAHIIDNERYPTEMMVHLVTGEPGHSEESTSASNAQWMNVLTADEEAWIRLGFSGRSSAAMVSAVEEGIGAPDELTLIRGFSAKEVRILRRLLDGNLLGVRSERFTVVCRTGRSTFEALLRREPGKGTVELLYLERVRHVIE